MWATEEVFDWLRVHCDACLALHLYLYGSFLSTPDAAEDVDLLVIYPEGQALAASRSRRMLESMFEEKFGLPLHAIHLSVRESADEADVIQPLLKAAKRLR